MRSTETNLLSDQFFQGLEHKEEKEEKLGFALPQSAETLQRFLGSKEGAEFRRGVKFILKDLRAWMAQNNVADNPKIDKFYKEKIEYTGSDSGMNVIMLALLQEGIPQLAKVVNFLSSYKLKLSSKTKLLARNMEDNTLYLQQSDNKLFYSIRNSKGLLITYEASPAELGTQMHQEIIMAIKDNPEELEEKLRQAFYKLAETRSYHPPPSAARLAKQRDTITNLINSLDVCAPGAHTNINDAFFALATDLKLELMEYRKNHIQQLILEAMKSFIFHRGNEIHYVNTIINKHSAAKFI